MKLIKGVYNLSYTDYNIFNVKLCNTITMLQKDGQEVEVQYKPLNIKGELCHIALILGRVESGDLSGEKDQTNRPMEKGAGALHS